MKSFGVRQPLKPMSPHYVLCHFVRGVSILRQFSRGISGCAQTLQPDPEMHVSVHGSISGTLLDKSYRAYLHYISLNSNSRCWGLVLSKCLRVTNLPELLSGARLGGSEPESDLYRSGSIYPFVSYMTR